MLLDRRCCHLIWKYVVSGGLLAAKWVDSDNVTPGHWLILTQIALRSDQVLAVRHTEEVTDVAVMHHEYCSILNHLAMFVLVNLLTMLARCR
jgi:hypothetical protein